MTVRCIQCHGFRRLAIGATGSKPCPRCSGLTDFQEGCLAVTARNLLQLARSAIEAKRRRRFDTDVALDRIVEALSCLAAGFDDDVDTLTLQGIIKRAGLSRGLQRTPANDDAVVPMGAA